MHYADGAIVSLVAWRCCLLRHDASALAAIVLALRVTRRYVKVGMNTVYIVVFAVPFIRQLLMLLVDT